ncbi:hypothetical protein VTL71DRAFT_4000 [Oculimacula yallundae]|uniref:Uncharacterized protein n=1 Tax=Oculimacula yallundae TaxID=86028 RepID=A0ABR4C4K2_9HELO
MCPKSSGPRYLTAMICNYKITISQYNTTALAFHLDTSISHPLFRTQNSDANAPFPLAIFCALCIITTLTLCQCLVREYKNLDALERQQNLALNAEMEKPGLEEIVDVTPGGGVVVLH